MNNQQSQGIDFTPVSQGSVPSNIDFTPQMTPDQSAQALGQSNGILTNLLGGAQAAGNFGLGVAKSGIHTGMELGKLTAEAGSQIPGPAGQFFQDRLQAGEQAMDKPVLQPQGAAQQAGYAAGDIAQFFSPAGEEKLGLKASEYIGKIPEIAGKATKYIKGALGIGAKAGTTAAKMGAVTTAETGDPSKGVEAAKLGAFAGGVSGALEAVAPNLLQSLAKSNFRLTPQGEAKATKVVDDSAKFLQKNKVTGTPRTKFVKMENVTTDLESMLQNSLKTAVKGAQVDSSKLPIVPKQDIINSITQTVEQLKTDDPAVYKQAAEQAKAAIKILQGQPGDAISLDTALAGKRSYGKAAFRFSQKGKVADPTVTAEGQYAVEQGYQDALESSLAKQNATIKIPEKYRSYFGGQSNVSMSDFNKVYSQAINTRKLLFAAQFRDNPTLFGRLFTLALGKMAGEAAGGKLGGIVGMTTAEVMAGPAMTGLQLGAEQTLSHPQIPTIGAKWWQGASNANEPAESQ